MTAFERAEAIAARIHHIHHGPNDPCAIRDQIMSAIYEEIRSRELQIDALKKALQAHHDSDCLCGLLGVMPVQEQPKVEACSVCGSAIFNSFKAKKDAWCGTCKTLVCPNCSEFHKLNSH